MAKLETSNRDGTISLKLQCLIVKIVVLTFGYLGINYRKYEEKLLQAVVQAMCAMFT